jgi:hypothetical protein
MVFLRIIGSPPKQEASFGDGFALCRSGRAGENPHFELCCIVGAFGAFAQIGKSLR